MRFGWVSLLDFGSERVQERGFWGVGSTSDLGFGGSSSRVKVWEQSSRVKRGGFRELRRGSV